MLCLNVSDISFTTFKNGNHCFIICNNNPKNPGVQFGQLPAVFHKMHLVKRG